MGTDFFSYAELLEMLAFFSGYPLIYFIVLILAGKKETKKGVQSKLIPFLTIAYAISGTMYLGLQLKNLYPNYSLYNIGQNIYHPVLKALALLSVVFWLPVLRKRPLISLFHSFIFFFIVVNDLWQNMMGNADNDIVKNDMKLFTISLLINTSTLVIIILIYVLFKSFVKKHEKQA